MNNHKLAGKNVWYVFISLVLSLSIYLAANSVFSAAEEIGLDNQDIFPVTPPPVNTLNSATTDAIAVRIVANPAQYSIDDWYAQQGFIGSPQKIKVDGYEAVRDNRTVYAAATNIKGFCDYSLPGGGPGDGLMPSAKSAPAASNAPCSNNSDCRSGTCVLSRIYFNIYIITYNQNATAQTTDVFGKILASWKFNNNINNQLGTCSFPPKNCGSDSDCGSDVDYTCSNFKCISTHKCLSDADCQSGVLCTSVKSSLLRDVKRLQSLNIINQSLKAYKDLHNKYPILAAGTFLPQAVISTWPSWQNVFVSQIGTSGLVDPINKIGVCNTTANATTTMAGFDGATCWNGTTRKYYNSSNSGNLELPAGSYALAYTTDVNGSNYKLCANMETNFSFMSYDNNLVNLGAANCQTTAPAEYTGASNNPPIIVAMNLNGVAGQEFNGYIKAEDPDGDPLTFSILHGFYPIDYWSSWDGGIKPVLKSTNDPKQKKLWSAQAGDAGPYNIALMVTDSNGASVTTSTVIKIATSAPVITTSDMEYDLSADPNNSLNYNLYFDDANFDYLELSLASVARNWFKNLSAWFIAPAWAQKRVVLPAEVGIPGGKLIVPIDIGGSIPKPPRGCSNIFSGGVWRVNKTLTNCFNLNNGLKGKIYTEADGRYRLNIYGTINISDYDRNTNLNYKVTVHNSLDKTAKKNFIIKLISNPPQLDFSCNKKASLYQSYTCQINNLNTKNQSTTYSYSYIDSAGQENPDLPSGFIGDPNSGLISGVPVNLGNYKLKITAYNEYKVSAYNEYDLMVESFCGQQLVPYPGGPWNQTGEVKNQDGYYKTVLIGGQCWLGDNLNVPFITNIGVCYNNDNTYCEAEGRLYKASEAMANSVAPSTRGICPTGYHIPSQEEYATLVSFLGTNPGDDLRQNGDSGFEAFLAGSAEAGATSTIFYDRNSFSNFWSSTIGNTDGNIGNWYRTLNSGPSFGESQAVNDSKYYSLRCIQDKPCPSNCDNCNTVGICCTINSWTPATNTKCGTFIQTSNCNTTQNVSGTITCAAPKTCGGGGTPGACGYIPSCTPNCFNKDCGADGCGGSCGQCPWHWPNCNFGHCQ